MHGGQKRGWGETFEAAEEKITEAFFENPLGRIATRAEEPAKPDTNRDLQVLS